MFIHPFFFLLPSACRWKEDSAVARLIRRVSSPRWRTSTSEGAGRLRGQRRFAAKEKYAHPTSRDIGAKPRVLSIRRSSFFRRGDRAVSTLGRVLAAHGQDVPRAGTTSFFRRGRLAKSPGPLESVVAFVGNQVKALLVNAIVGWFTKGGTRQSLRSCLRLRPPASLERER